MERKEIAKIGDTGITVLASREDHLVFLDVGFPLWRVAFPTRKALHDFIEKLRVAEMEAFGVYPSEDKERIHGKEAN